VAMSKKRSVVDGEDSKQKRFVDFYFKLLLGLRLP